MCLSGLYGRIQSACDLQGSRLSLSDPSARGQPGSSGLGPHASGVARSSPRWGIPIAWYSTTAVPCDRDPPIRTLSRCQAGCCRMTSTRYKAHKRAGQFAWQAERKKKKLWWLGRLATSLYSGSTASRRCYVQAAKINSTLHEPFWAACARARGN